MQRDRRTAGWKPGARLQHPVKAERLNPDVRRALPRENIVKGQGAPGRWWARSASNGLPADSMLDLFLAPV